MTDRPARLADNIVHFGRMLRRAGLPVGPDRIGQAILAAEAVGVDRREDFRVALRASLIGGPDQIALFEAAFALFWRSGHLGAHLAVERPAGWREAVSPAPAAARVLAAFFERPPPDDGGPGRQSVRMAISQAEALRRRDFAQMSAAEIAAADAALAGLAMPGDRVATRRLRAARHGAIDPRRTLRMAMRSGGEVLLPARRNAALRPPPIVAIVDISGSMSAYSRAVLHFLHAMGGRRRVETFLFGTRLTYATRALRGRDVDAALGACSAAVPDWSGGTRIGEALHAFNRFWSRRVLGQGAIVLLVTDGLEREDLGRLAAEAERLHLSCRRLVWLNPLLRYEGFEAKAGGVRTLLPHVDEIRSIHSLASVEALVEALSGRAAGGDPRRFMAAV